MKWTETDFPEVSWHDCQIHSITLDQEGEWQSDLVMDIDFITEWLCGTDKGCRFRVAPATLRFMNVDNLRFDISLKFKQPLVIDSVDRSELLVERFQMSHWAITIQGYPDDTGSLIEFDASGFTQELTGYTRETESQSLTPSERNQLRQDWGNRGPAR